MADNLPTPESRVESYLAKAAGEDVTIPEKPLSRIEQYLNAIAEGGGGGGTSDFDQLTNRPKYNGAPMTGETNIPESTTYTAGDGIDIVADVIKATNTGKARVLTTDDYNYPTDNPAYVALWLLEPGVYTREAGTVAVRWKRASAGSTDLSNAYIFVIGSNGTLVASSSSLIKTFIMSGGSATVGYPKIFLRSEDIVDNLTSTSTITALSANQGKVLKDLVDSIAIRASGAPTTSTVGSVGTLYEDTTNGKLYQCTDTTGGTYTWVEVGGGSGPTVVQSTGTSTTDVMSQNAVTSMVYADPSTKSKVQIGNNGATGLSGVAIGDTALSSGNHSTALGNSARAYGDYSVAAGHFASGNGNGAVAVGYSAGTVGGISKRGTVSIGAYAKAAEPGEMAIGSTDTSYGYNNSNYRLLTGLYDPQSAHDAATKGYVDGTTETYTIATSDWSALSASSPYDYQATVTATYTIGANTIAELLNDSPVDFATYGFAIGSISSQSVTIYSIGQPSASVSLKVNYKG